MWEGVYPRCAFPEFKFSVSAVTYGLDYRTPLASNKSIHDHRTGRKCTASNCNGILLDTIIHFGEYLPTLPLQLARQHGKKADLCLVLGSSLTIPPANTIPETVGKNKKARLVICNLQPTPLDNLADLRVWAETDRLMKKVMEGLEIEVPEFRVRRRVIAEVCQRDGKRRCQIKVWGVDHDGVTPMSFLKGVKLVGDRRMVKEEPFLIGVKEELEVGVEVRLELEFMGHYREPNFEVGFLYKGEGVRSEFWLEYDPGTGEWKGDLLNLQNAYEKEMQVSCVGYGYILEDDEDDAEL